MWRTSGPTPFPALGRVGGLPDGVVRTRQPVPSVPPPPTTPALLLLA